METIKVHRLSNRKLYSPYTKSYVNIMYIVRAIAQGYRIVCTDAPTGRSFLKEIMVNYLSYCHRDHLNSLSEEQLQQLVLDQKGIEPQRLEIFRKRGLESQKKAA